MKKVAIIYRTSENQEVIDFLKDSLERIFENYIFVENYYLTELTNNSIIDADAYLLTEERMIYPLKKHVTNYNNIIIMNRSINKSHLEEVRLIPKGTDVLVVNDAYESAIQTLCSLYELGITHINLVPFDHKDADNPMYGNFNICITPNEVQLVPKNIKNIINIGYREISINTLMSLMTRLNLDFELTNRNLVRHIRSIAEPDMYLYNDYLNNFVKNHIFDSVINDSPSALIITNEKYHLLFTNKKAKDLFNIKKNSTAVALSDIMNDDCFAAIKEDIMPKNVLVINEVQYFIKKTPIMLVDEVMGYEITFQSEKDLVDIEINAKKLIEKKGLYAKYNFSDIIHDSPAMQECINTAKTVALTDHTVLITGESGTGKELIAQSIHNYSKRKDKTFVAINCASLSESLLESELFGYEGGSFTGARKSGKLGLFEQANNGTIFLDEIGDISPQMQSKLLRVLQERQIMRVGGDKLIQINTRILAATNKDLADEVEKGNFRSDLYYRLNVITINIEPLRNRREDILPLMSNSLGKKFNQLTDLDKRLLSKYSWPGNVRELENAAIHFNTLNRLPQYIVDTYKESVLTLNSSTQADEKNIEMKILKIIMKNTQLYHGIGRTQLNTHLKESQIYIGDASLRNVLHKLKEEGLVTIGKGRSGTKITDLGIEKIKSIEQNDIDIY